jgi:hypothetical protein
MGSHREPDCWNIQTEVVMSILADDESSMAVDLLLATSEPSPELLSSETLTPQSPSLLPRLERVSKMVCIRAGLPEAVERLGEGMISWF